MVTLEQSTWLDTKDAAAYLRTTVGRMAVDRSKGVGMRFFRYGRKILYRRDDLDAFLEQFACIPPGKATETVGGKDG